LEIIQRLFDIGTPVWGKTSRLDARYEDSHIRGRAVPARGAEEQVAESISPQLQATREKFMALFGRWKLSWFNMV
jgi:hypothetical protein